MSEGQWKYGDPNEGIFLLRSCPFCGDRMEVSFNYQYSRLSLHAFHHRNCPQNDYEAPQRLGRAMIENFNKRPTEDRLEKALISANKKLNKILSTDIPEDLRRNLEKVNKEIIKGIKSRKPLKKAQVYYG